MPQAITWTGPDTSSVALAAQAQLDGFKVRAIKTPALAAQKHLYNTAWKSLETKPEPPSRKQAPMLMLSDEAVPGYETLTAKSDMKALTVRLEQKAVSAMVSVVALQRKNMDRLPLFALDVARVLVQTQAANNKIPLVVRLVTCGAQLPGGTMRPHDAGVWGLARSARAEAQLAAACIDGPAKLSLGVPLAEPEVALRGINHFVPRMAASTEVAAGHVRLHFHSRGAISNLFLETQPILPLRDGDVVVRMRSVGLNFRDVLNVLGEYPGDPGPPGADTSGLLENAKPGYPIAIGEPIFGLGTAPLAVCAYCIEPYVAHKPKSLSFEQASTLPVTWTTTHVSYTKSQVRSGNRLLIHAGAGGVGMKAVEYGQWLNATLSSNAGRPNKHSQLVEMNVTHLLSSREPTAFAYGNLSLLASKRQHNVLNSLSVDFITVSFASIGEGPNAAFAEIGKISVCSYPRHDVIHPFSNYYPIAIDLDMVDDPAWMHRTLVICSSRATTARVSSLPVTSFDFESQFENAFRMLQKGLNIGKVVVRMVARATPGSKGSHVVSGGTGGLGLLTGRWLMQHGAKGVALTSRSGSVAKDAIAEWDALVAISNATGSPVTRERCDGSEESDIKRLIPAVEQAFGGPLTGIWHSAGVLADALLPKQTAGSFARSFAPKAASAFSLHLSTGPLALAVCCWFSSIAALLGGAGQANYCSSNLVLDALAHCRQVRGTSGVAMQWGAWAEVGMAARGAAAERMAAMEAAQGLSRIGLAQGLGALATAVRYRGASAVAVLPVQWSRMLGGGRVVPAFLSAFTPAKVEKTEKKAKGGAVVEKQDGVSLETVLEIVNRIAAGSGGYIAADVPLMEAGVDSLGMVELGNQLQAASGGEALPSTLVFDHPTARSLAVLLQPEETQEEEPVSAMERDPAPPVRSGAAGAEGQALSYGPAAVCGMSVRFPGGVNTKTAVRRFVVCSIDAVGEVPASRWDTYQSAVDNGVTPRVASRARHGGFINQVELADNKRFSVSPAECAAMDPQQRILLEDGYFAMHEADVDRVKTPGALTGIFLGFGNASDFQAVLAASPAGSSVYAATGSTVSIASGRLSYVLGFHGPCVSYDTACSAALAANHAGLRALQFDENVSTVGFKPLSLVRTLPLSPT